MTSASHMLVATAVYSLTKSNRPIALLLAFATHFLLDAIPHYEPPRVVNYIIGSISGVFILYISFINHDVYILIAMFLGALPDLNWMFSLSRNLDRFHSFIHIDANFQKSKLLLASDIVFSVISIVYLYM